MLFALSVNPLSYLFSKEKGYAINVTAKAEEILHLFFVDDLKRYASSLNNIMKLLDIITRFTNDVRMKFSESKCAYQWIERRLMVGKGKPIRLGGLTIKEIENGDSYRYLGIDESVGALGPLNKEKITKDYRKRLRKIWNSKLNGRNKVTAHITFAIPIITPTIGKWR